MAGEQRQQPREERAIVMEYTTGLPTDKFADLLTLIRLRGGGGRGASAEPGAEGLAEGGADLHASQCDTGGDRRSAGYVPVHDLAGHRGRDRCDRPGPEGRAAHGRGGAPGVRLRAGRHFSPAGVGVITANCGRANTRRPA